MDNATLVSVIVITYNSAATVIETLDSIKNQDYPNVELIVADDCSKDDTTDVVKKWLDDNGSRFVRVELVTSSHNTGVSGNLNRGVERCQGTWIKIIAGDDLLLRNCISENVLCADSNNGVCAIFSRAQFFGDAAICKRYEHFGYGFFGLNNRERYLLLLTYNTILAPTEFISREYLKSVGGYDEEIPFIEDWPFWIKMFRNNNKVAFINKETVRYRMGSSLSLGNGGGERFNDSHRRVLEYAYRCQMQENIVYRVYAFLSKKKREKKSVWFSLLIRLNIYHYYYIFLNKKISLASRRFNSLKEESNAHTLV